MNAQLEYPSKQPPMDPPLLTRLDERPANKSLFENKVQELGFSIMFKVMIQQKKRIKK